MEHRNTKKTAAKIPPELGEDRQRMPEELRERARRSPHGKGENGQPEERKPEDDDPQSCDGND